MSAQIQLHGTCVALGRYGVLLRGAPGSGKSDLALRFLAEGDLSGVLSPSGAASLTEMMPALIADDQVIIRAEAGLLLASAPDNIAGLLEVRGIGIITMPHQSEAELALIVDLVEPEDVPRMPSEPWPREELLGVALPVLRLAPQEPSAPLKLGLALRRVIGQ